MLCVRISINEERSLLAMVTTSRVCVLLVAGVFTLAKWPHTNTNTLLQQPPSYINRKIYTEKTISRHWCKPNECNTFSNYYYGCWSQGTIFFFVSSKSMIRWIICWKSPPLIHIFQDAYVLYGYYFALLAISIVDCDVWRSYSRIVAIAFFF